MVNNWEIEWNSSMMEHGRDLGTMEFIFAKGGTVADMNYVMFDVQDNSWEPLIKAVAERDNSHPDIIRKNVQEQGALGVPQGMTPGVAVNPQMVVAANPRAVRRANQALDAQQRGQAVREGSTNVGDLYGAGFKGRAAMQAGKNIMGAGRRGLSGAKDMAGRGLSAAKDMGGRALTAVKNSGIGQRMGNFMGKVGRGISDLRHAPAAAKQSFGQMQAAGEDEARRSTLEGGLGRGAQELETAEGRYVPGSQGFDANMDRARASTSQGLARDFNITPQVHTKGKNKGMPKESVEDAMRREIQEIGARRAEPKEGFFAGMKRRGDERRADNQAQAEGAAYAPSNVVPEAEPEPPAMPKAPTPEAAQAADTDIVPKEEEEEFVFNEPQSGPETGTPPQDAGKPMEVEPETATATETSPNAREEAFRQMLGRQDGAKGTGYDLGGKSGKDAMGRAMESDVDLSNVDQQLTEEMLQGMGIKNNKIGQAIMQRIRALPQFVKEKAAQGDPQAKERVQDEAEAAVEEEEFQFNNPDMASEMAEIDNFGLSEDNHEASWDSLLKGLDIR